MNVMERAEILFSRHCLLTRTLKKFWIDLKLRFRQSNIVEIPFLPVDLVYWGGVASNSEKSCEY